MTQPGLVSSAMQCYVDKYDVPEVFVDVNTQEVIEELIDEASWPTKLDS